MRTRRQVDGEWTNRRECKALKRHLRAYNVEGVLERLQPDLPGQTPINEPMRIGKRKLQPEIKRSKSQMNYRGGIRLLITWAQSEKEDLVKPSESFGRRYVLFLMAKYDGRRATIATRLSHAQSLFYFLQTQWCVDPGKCHPFSADKLADVWHVSSSNSKPERNGSRACSVSVAGQGE